MEPQDGGVQWRGGGEKWVTLGDPCSVGILGRSEAEYLAHRLDWESDEVRCGICFVLNIHVALGKSLCVFSLPFTGQLHSHGTMFPRCGTMGLK